MSILAELSVVPLGKGESVSQYVARCVEVVKKSKLPYELHSMGTEFEAHNFQQVADVVSRCIDRLSDECDRLEITLRLDCRKHREHQLTEKVASVQRQMA